MKKGPEIEIPESMRDLAEQSVEQAQEAYSRFMDAARNASNMMSKSSDAMTEGAKNVQDQAIGFIEKNMQENFEHAEEMVRAKDIQEALKIQSEFARKQVEAYAEQAKVLSELMTKAAKKAQPKS